MRDELVRVHLKDPSLLAVGVLCTDTARHACRIHRCLPTAAGVLSQALAAGFGIAGLLGGEARINLQVSCDGPLKGLLIDADAEGAARGYVRNPSVNFLVGEGLEAAPALGGSGLLSVLRELHAGEFYRGSIALEHFELSRDLERFYRESEQIETLVVLEAGTSGLGADGAAGRVAAVLVQRLPGAPPQALERARATLAGGLPGASRAMDLLRPLLGDLGDGFDVQAEYPLCFKCGCSMEKVLGAVFVLGRAELEDILAREGRAIATCAFCATVYEVSRAQLQAMLDQLAAAAAGEEPN